MTHPLANLEEHAMDLRIELRDAGRRILKQMDHQDLDTPPRGADVSNVNEAKANIMIAYRHVEDAVMRLGKIVQAMDGGTSIFPR